MCRPKSPKDCRSTGKVGKDTKLGGGVTFQESTKGVQNGLCNCIPPPCSSLSLLEGSFSY